jgi:hypothetical protein
MVSFEFLAIILTGLGLTASIVYYSTILQNANKTRKLQAYNALRQVFTNYDFMRRYVNVVYHQQWENAEEFDQKYGPTVNPDEYTDFGFLFASLQMAGMLLKEKYVAIDILYDDTGYAFIPLYEKYKPIIDRLRERAGRAWPQLEYLYDRLIEYGNQHPELNP